MEFSMIKKNQIIFLFLFISSVYAADGKKDSVIECSKTHKVLFENEVTRIIQVKQGGGEICPMSFHANHFAIHNKTVEIKITFQDGNSAVYKIPEGTNSMVPENTFSFEIKSGQLDVIAIEFK
jgi:hypothetical protein